MRCLLPLPVHDRYPSSRFRSLRAQPDQLRHAQAGRVQHLDERAIAQTARRGDIGLPDEPLDLFDRRETSAAPATRAALEDRRRDWPVRAGPAPGSDRSPGRRRPCAPPIVATVLRSSGRRRNSRDRGGRAAGSAVLDARREFSKTLEIAAVAFQRVFGQAPFDPQMREIGVDELVSG